VFAAVSSLAISAASAQDPPTESSASRPAPRSHSERARLETELTTLDAEGPEFVNQVGLQFVFCAALATTVGSVMELFSQELSARWRFDEPPWFFIGGALVGLGLAAIGVPLVIYGWLEPRSVRHREIERRLEALDTLTVLPSITSDGASLVARLRF
jgi:hypothetical protein